MVYAAAAAELHAPPEVWPRIKPAVDAAALRANSLVPGPGEIAANPLREIGGETRRATSGCAERCSTRCAKPARMTSAGHALRQGTAHGSPRADTASAPRCSPDVP